MASERLVLDFLSIQLENAPFPPSPNMIGTLGELRQRTRQPTRKQIGCPSSFSSWCFSFTPPPAPTMSQMVLLAPHALWHACDRHTEDYIPKPP